MQHCACYRPCCHPERALFYCEAVSVRTPNSSHITPNFKKGWFFMKCKRLFSALLALYVVLGCWKGYVALFERGAAEPRQIFPTPVASLPEADQGALEQGIIVRNDRDLQQLLEDYLS